MGITVPFDRLRELISSQTSEYQPLVEDNADEGLNVRQSDWRGHTVSGAERLLDAMGGLHAETGKELKARLFQRYGGYIQGYLAKGFSDDKEISQRKVVALETKAHALLHSIQKTNKKKMDGWIKDISHAGLVAEQFERVTGYRWDTVKEHERRLMVDQVRAVLAKQPAKLTKASASNLAFIYLQNHQSYFSRTCVETASVLKNLTGWQEPLMVEHLSEWSAYVADDPEWGLIQGDHQMVSNFQFLTNRTMFLVTSSGLEDSDYVLYQQQIEAVEQQKSILICAIMDLKKYPLQLPQNLRRAMLSDLQVQFRDVSAYKHQLEVHYFEDPRSLEEWQSIKKVEVVAAHRALGGEIEKLFLKEFEKGLSDKEEKRLQQCEAMREELDVLGKAIGEGVDGDQLHPMLGAKEGSKKQKILTDAVTYRKALSVWLSGSGIPKKRLKELVTFARNSVLVEADWKPIEQQVSARINGKPYQCVSQITPATNLSIDILGGDVKKAKADIYPVHYDGTGRPSTLSYEATHAVNLCETSLVKEGVEQFRGMRSGTLCAFGIDDPDKRAEASKNRVRELVVSALRIELERNPDGLDTALHSGVAVPLKMLSTSLLSPDKFRHYTHIHDDEYNMYLEQVIAVKEVQVEVREKGYLEIVDQTGKKVEMPVDLDIITANFGVNPISLNPLLKQVQRPWGVAEKESREALDVLMGSVKPGTPIEGWAGEFLEGYEDDHDKQIVIQLVEQIRHLYVTEGYKSEGEDAYKLIERLQVLSYKIGVVGHFNCKSGKDRTGEADASTKRLIAQIDALGYVPDPDLPLSREEQVLLQLFYFYTGNVLLQRKNLNLPGYKTRTGKKQYGEEVYRMAHRPDYGGVVG